MTKFFTYFSSIPEDPEAFHKIDYKIFEEFVDVDSYEIDEMPVYVINNSESNEMTFAAEFRKYILEVLPSGSGLTWFAPIDLNNERHESWMGERALKVRDFLFLKGYYN